MKLTRKQREYIREADKRWNIKVGGTGTGKTFVDYTYIIPFRTRQFKDTEGANLMVGVTTATLERNVLEPMRNLYGEGLVNYINRSNGTVNLFGEVYHVIGAEKENATNKIQGMTVKYIYGDEFVNWNESFFRMLTTRMRAKNAMADLTGNPDHPNHWAKQFIDRMLKDNLVFYQNSTIKDNPMLPKEFVSSQEIELKGTTDYTRLILGQWASAEGSIYPMLNEKHKVSLKEWEELKENVRFVQVGVDFGGNQSKTAFQATAVMNDKSIITIKEQRFELEEDIDKINQEFEKFIQDLTDQKYEIRIVRPDNAETVIINSMRTYAKQKGFISPKKIRNARKGAINERIRTYQRLLNLYKYRILETCTITYEAFENAVWSDKVDSKGKDVRLDNGTLNIDTLDAQEYSTEELHDSLLKG